MKRLPVFITGNQEKANRLGRLLGLELEHLKLDLDEIQSSDPSVVIDHKARQAYGAVSKPVLVDDASMWFNALNGLPGPLIKLFVHAPSGLENLCRMADGLASRRATAQAYFGIYDGETMTIMHGEISGEIADHPRGNGGFTHGWDNVFCLDGHGGKTLAELSQKEFDEVYAQIRPIAKLKKYLEEKL
ncbi:non-canonical purine NTP pyrophosphatase [Candidatus Saccharibacteria bacterium]|nr:MAG: non-canonical purine NTP pyrophosphatase [Candidatus Saccharibacteria bacterium]